MRLMNVLVVVFEFLRFVVVLYGRAKLDWGFDWRRVSRRYGLHRLGPVVGDVVFRILLLKAVELV